MTSLADSQERARFNRQEALWWEFQCLRILRRLDSPTSDIPNDIADSIDWWAAVRAVPAVPVIHRPAAWPERVSGKKKD